jgi:hypothetical protein
MNDIELLKAQVSVALQEIRQLQETVNGEHAVALMKFGRSLIGMHNRVVEIETKVFPDTSEGNRESELHGNSSPASPSGDEPSAIDGSSWTTEPREGKEL